MQRLIDSTPSESLLPESLSLLELLTHAGRVLKGGIAGAVWVRAEVSSLSDRRHLYLDLLDADQPSAAKCRATLWASRRQAIEARFREATGQDIGIGQQLLLFCTVELHAQYGFSLHIHDIAVAWSQGQQAREYMLMTQTLADEGLLDLNRRFSFPEDFFRVAVLSPEGAACLEDVRRELDPLNGVGLLEVEYASAVFQGAEAAKSLLNALQRLYRQHQNKPLDALLLVRGGGSATDLGWLNHLGLARSVAYFPVPVLTGLGHARDRTLLDEVAHTVFDTPSKAAAAVVRGVYGRAQRIERDLQSIWRVVRREHLYAQQQTERALARAYRAADGQCRATEWQLQALMRQILNLSPQQTQQRGYVLLRQDGWVKRRSVLRSGEAALYFQDGVARVRIEVLSDLSDEALS